MPWLYVLFEIVLFGTLVETAAGFIKALEDRVEQSLLRSCSLRPNRPASSGPAPSGSSWPWLARPLITGAVTALGVCVSTFGLTDLIDKGYGAICYGALLLFALPMLTAGVRMIRRNGA